MVIDFEKRINYFFKNRNLFEAAITHSTYAYENKLGFDNQRLEFLGDAVLELTISDYLFNSYGDKTEGELTKLRASIVCEASLAKYARLISLGDIIKLGKGEEATGGRHKDSVLSDAMEALFGAIFLDSGFEATRDFIISLMHKQLSGEDSNLLATDFKTLLQEKLQRTSSKKIIYNLISESGPDHEKVFVSEVVHEDKALGRGTGKSKKESEQDAACNALSKLKL